MPTERSLCVAYLGNFGPPHSTETHVAKAWENEGHTVDRFQENDLGQWLDLQSRVAGYDLVFWTRTGWNPPVPHTIQRTLLAAAADVGAPTVGFHLDRWWGLDREGQVLEEPFFRAAMVFTADGGHDERWVEAGVNHRWLPPGVSGDEARRQGVPRSDLRAKVAFVGSWRSYHPEWVAWRRRLVEGLGRHFGADFRTWEGGVRGQDLADLYASVDVLVGDSCLVGLPARYWSDRVPETLGRGGFLVHPRVEGIEDHFRDGQHLALVPPCDLDAMIDTVEHWLAHPAERTEVAAAGRAHTWHHHTYERRVQQIVATLEEAKLL